MTKPTDDKRPFTFAEVFGDVFGDIFSSNIFSNTSASVHHAVSGGSNGGAGKQGELFPTNGSSAEPSVTYGTTSYSGSTYNPFQQLITRIEALEQAVQSLTQHIQKDEDGTP